MNERLSITELPKTSTFQMRINPEIKSKAESIFSNCGLTLTDTENSKNILMEQAFAILMNELKKGENCNESDFSSIDDVAKDFGVQL